MSWLAEGQWLVYLVLGLTAGVCLFLFRQNQERKYLFGAAILLGAAGLYFLLDLAIATDSETIERKVKAMARSIEAKSSDGVVEHMSNDFRIGSFDKKAIRSRADFLMKENQVQSVKVWDFEPATAPDVKTLVEMGLKEEEAQNLVRDRKVLEMTFKAKASGAFTGDAAFYFVRAVFVRDPDGQFRLRTFQVQHPLTGQVIQPGF